MAARGWTVPEWPKEYGGGGLARDEGKILREEMAQLGCRSPLDSFGIWMLGPALLQYGIGGAEEALTFRRSREARSAGARATRSRTPAPTSPRCRPAPRTRATTSWSTARRSGPRYADKADWIFCLVRTDPKAQEARGHQLHPVRHGDARRLDQADLADLGQARRSARPSSTTCGCRRRSSCGELNKGWDVAKYLLTHERNMIGGMGERGGGRPMRELAAMAVGRDERGELDDPMSARRRSRPTRSTRSLSCCVMERAGDIAKARQVHPAFSSALKYYGTELNKRRAELTMSGLGSDATGMGIATHAEGSGAARLAAHQGQFHRGRHQRGAAQHRGQAHPRLARRLVTARFTPDFRGVDMALILTEEQGMLRDSARSFLAENAPLAQLRQLRDSRDEYRLLARGVEEVRRDGLHRHPGA